MNMRSSAAANPVRRSKVVCGAKTTRGPMHWLVKAAREKGLSPREETGSDVSLAGGEDGQT